MIYPYIGTLKHQWNFGAWLAIWDRWTQCCGPVPMNHGAKSVAGLNWWDAETQNYLDSVENHNIYSEMLKSI